MKNLLQNNGIDWMVISNPINIKYLSWFSWSNWFLIILNNKTYLITDTRYLEWEILRKGKEKNWLIILNTKEDKWKKLLNKVDTIWIEADHITLSKFSNLKKELRINWNKNKFRKIVSACSDKRIIKSENEIKMIKKSEDITSSALLETIKYIKKWKTELDIVKIFENIAIDLWAESMSFSPHIAFWKNTSMPHYTPWNSKLKKWDLIMCDVGAVYQWYCSDLTRMFFTDMNSEIETMYNILLEAQVSSIKFVNEWMKSEKIYNHCSGILKKYWVDKKFTHWLWHWVWLEIHESPSLCPNSKTIIREWMVFTIEPWIYFPWKFWMRIEDLWLMTKKWYKPFSKIWKKITYLNI